VGVLVEKVPKVKKKKKKGPSTPRQFSFNSPHGKGIAVFLILAFPLFLFIKENANKMYQHSPN
jgi:hypothetical protein